MEKIHCPYLWRTYLYWMCKIIRFGSWQRRSTIFIVVKMKQTKGNAPYCTLCASDAFASPRHLVRARITYENLSSARCPLSNVGPIYLPSVIIFLYKFWYSTECIYSIRNRSEMHALSPDQCVLDLQLMQKKNRNSFAQLFDTWDMNIGVWHIVMMVQAHPVHRGCADCNRNNKWRISYLTPYGPSHLWTILWTPKCKHCMHT